MDIIPFRKVDAPLESDGEEERARRALLEVEDEGDWCLFSVDVRNVYGLPFEVTFERKQDGMVVMLPFGGFQTYDYYL